MTEPITRVSGSVISGPGTQSAIWFLSRKLGLGDC